jgi:hypothetical protein
MTEFYAYLDGNRTNNVLPEHLRKVVDFTNDNEVVKAASMLYYTKNKDAAQAHFKTIIEQKYPDNYSFLNDGQSIAGWMVPLLAAVLFVVVVVDIVAVGGPPPLY